MKISKAKGSYLRISCDLNKYFSKLSQFPGFKKWDERDLLFRPAGNNMRFVLETFPEAEWQEDAIKHKEEFEELSAAHKDTLDAKEDGVELNVAGFNFKREPMEHQLKALQISCDRKVFGLFMEQGTGKTKVILDNANYLHEKGEIDALVVIAWPNGVHRNWIEYEVPADTNVQFASAAWKAGAGKGITDMWHKMIESKEVLRIFTFNVEAFASQKAKDMILDILKRNPNNMVVIDQSAAIKNPTAKRTKFLVKEVAPEAKYKRILDGAPVAEGAGELYSQFNFLDPRIIGHDTWTGFKAEFCNIGFYNNIIGYKNLGELHNRIDGHSFRVRSDDCLDLPKRIYRRWNFDLSKEERRIYDEMKRKSLAFFQPEEDEECAEGQILEEVLALTKNMRLQQIISGWFKDKDNDCLLDIGDVPSRYEALQQLLDHINGGAWQQKCLIFCKFKPDIELLHKMLPNSVAYYGGVSDDEKDEAKRKFMNDPETLFFIGQPRTAGIGHTLTAAKHIIFYSNDSSLRLREESEKRAHRKGLEHKLTIWDLMANRTVDSKIVRSLKEKKLLANEIMQDPDNYFLVEE